MKLAKLSVLATSLLVNAGALAAPNAGVGGGVVTFLGKIQATSCEIDTTLHKENFEVTLPTIPVSSFTASGQVRGTQQFQIALKNCPQGKVAGHFETIGGSGWDPGTGNLTTTKTAGSATKIQVRLLDSDGVTQIFPGNSGSSQTIVADGDAVRLTYFAGYFNTEQAVTAGTVTASVVYTLDYS